MLQSQPQKPLRESKVKRLPHLPSCHDANRFGSRLMGPIDPGQKIQKVEMDTRLDPGVPLLTIRAVGT
jgi:hypothetical protein